MTPPASPVPVTVSVSPAVAEITGRPSTDVMLFARDYAQAFAA
jgi:hypothetical protein